MRINWFEPRTKKIFLLVLVAIVAFAIILGIIINKHESDADSSSFDESAQSDSSQVISEISIMSSATESTVITSEIVVSQDVSSTMTISESEPSDDEFVRICDYIPSIITDLKYATADNFTGRNIYDFQEAYLRYGTVKKLMSAYDELSALGYNMKIWDAFRPYEAQCKLWDICPDPTYVSNPETGHLSHCRGNAVDITIVYNDGSMVEMPTDFDNFTTLADRDYSDVSDSAARNAKLLEDCMKRNGFNCYFGEWWHFSDTCEYPIEKEFLPKA